MRVARAAGTLGRFTIAEAFFSKVGLAALLILLAGLLLGQFAAQLALTDSAGIRVSMQAALYRLAAVFLVAGFTVASVVREHNDKSLELMLSLPIPRGGYLAGKWLGCAGTALIIAALFTGPLVFDAAPGAAFAWGLSLGLELILVASASLLCVLTISHVVASLAAVAAFYVLARSVGALLAIGASPVAPIDSTAYQAANWTLHAISTVLPRLDLFTRTAWLTGDAPASVDLPMVSLQTLIYVVLLVGSAFFDLSRKNV